jgi:hypothetical protein
MVEHVQPSLDQAGGRSAREARPRRRSLERAWLWVSREALLFPMVALFYIGLAGNLPYELFQDTWMVILGGREVVEHGLPSHDTLTIWTQGREWIDQQWLAQLIFYGLFALGGIKLALALHVAFAAAAFTLAVVVARRRGASARSLCWLVVPTYFLLSWGSWNARAQSIALLLFVSVVALLIRDSHSPSRRVFFVLPLLVLWANVHGTALTGALLVAVWGVTYAVERRRQPLREWAPRSAALIFAPFACLFVSPYAASLPGYYETMLFNSGFRQFIIEWHPTSPSFQTAPFYLVAFLAVWLIGRTKDRLLPFEQVLLVVTLVLALQTMRGVIWFTLVALMLLPVALDGVLRPNTGAMRFRLLNGAFVTVSVAATIATLAVVAAKPSSWFERSYPAGILAAYDRVQTRDPQMRVFANEAYGDWLLLRRPELRGRLAFDIRFELLTKQELRRLIDVTSRIEGWQRVVAPYSLFVLSKEPDAKLVAGLLRQRGARLEYRGHGAIVISRPAERLVLR